MSETRLDRALFALVDRHPEWIASLPPEQQQMLQMRRSGLRLSEIAAEYQLTAAAVRWRLYGKGTGLKRGGGILGHLRWRHNREGRQRLA